eukprot:scaffold3315_cov62-Phaeocystis_antarctica.AAC.8
MPRQQGHPYAAWPPSAAAVTSTSASSPSTAQRRRLTEERGGGAPVHVYNWPHCGVAPCLPPSSNLSASACTRGYPRRAAIRRSDAVISHIRRFDRHQQHGHEHEHQAHPTDHRLQEDQAGNPTRLFVRPLPPRDLRRAAPDAGHAGHKSQLDV